MSDNVVTGRLEIRPPTERDRPRFIELFTDEDFMVFFWDAVRSKEEAEERFDRMLALSLELPFAKQPIIERASGVVIGYTGVDKIDIDGYEWLEWGYRLVPEARGKGYATEASSALLRTASNSYTGDVLSIIHPENTASHNVTRKLGFEYWKRALVLNEWRDLYRLEL